MERTRRQIFQPVDRVARLSVGLHDGGNLVYLRFFSEFALAGSVIIRGPEPIRYDTLKLSFHSSNIFQFRAFDVQAHRAWRTLRLGRFCIGRTPCLDDQLKPLVAP
jgi:hypothetical protein